MDKLAKCPFCGGEALLFRGIGCMLVKCANAGCSLHDVDMGVASWNTRPLESAIDKLEQEKAELVEACKQAVAMLLHVGGCPDTVSKLEAALKKAEGKE